MMLLLLLSTNEQHQVLASSTRNRSSSTLAASAEAISSSESTVDFDVVALVNHDYVSTTHPAIYDCQVINRWTAKSHPIDYPDGSGAYWSAPVIVSHNNHYELWHEGEVANPGIVQLIDSGNNGILLQDELVLPKKKRTTASSSATTAVLHHVVGVDLPLTAGASSHQQDRQTIHDGLQVDQHHSLLSSISKFGSSPNSWFSGFTNFQPIHADSNTWLDQFILDTYPYDVDVNAAADAAADADADADADGTTPVTYLDDTGTDESSSLLISRISSSHFPSSGALLDPTMTHVKPVARWDCERRRRKDGDADASLLNGGNDGAANDGSASSFLRNGGSVDDGKPPTMMITDRLIDGSSHALLHEINDAERQPPHTNDDDGGSQQQQDDDTTIMTSSGRRGATSLVASIIVAMTMMILSF